MRRRRVKVVKRFQKLWKECWKAVSGHWSWSCLFSSHYATRNKTMKFLFIYSNYTKPAMTTSATFHNSNYLCMFGYFTITTGKPSYIPYISQLWRMEIAIIIISDQHWSFTQPYRLSRLPKIRRKLRLSHSNRYSTLHHKHLFSFFFTLWSFFNFFVFKVISTPSSKETTS